MPYKKKSSENKPADKKIDAGENINSQVEIDENSEEVEESTELEKQEFKDKVDPFKAILQSMQVGDKDKQGLDMTEFTEAFKEGMQALINPVNRQLRMSTDLNENTIISLAVMRSIGEFYHLSSVTSFLDNYELMRVSKGREGRQELLKLLEMLNKMHLMSIAANSDNPSLLGTMSQNSPLTTGNEAIAKPKSRWSWFRRG